MHIAKIIRFDRTNVIAKASSQAKACHRRRDRTFHGAGEAASVGAAEVSDEGDRSGAEPVPALGGSGAVVVVGARDAGGGNDKSVSGGGSSPLLPLEDACGAGSCLAASAVFFGVGDGTAAMTLSPSLARN